MNKFSIPLELLNLEDIEIVETVITSDNAIIIRVQSTKEEIQCRVCGRPTKPYGKGRTLKLQHLSILGKKTYIEITPSRGVCPYCKDKTTTTQISKNIEIIE